jgi:hypothetical protein
MVGRTGINDVNLHVPDPRVGPQLGELDRPNATNLATGSTREGILLQGLLVANCSCREECPRAVHSNCPSQLL